MTLSKSDPDGLKTQEPKKSAVGINMNKETTQLQLVIVFILGSTIFLLSWWKASDISHPDPLLVMTEPPLLNWEDNKLLFSLDRRNDPASFHDKNIPAQLRPIFFQPIPINQATEELLVTISGIGPVLAQRIVVYRETIGHYQDYVDLIAVRGIGQKRAMMIAEHVSFER